MRAVGPDGDTKKDDSSSGEASYDINVEGFFATLQENLQETYDLLVEVQNSAADALTTVY